MSARSQPKSDIEPERSWYGHGVQAAGAFEKRKIMGDEATGQEHRAEPAGPIGACDQVADIGGETADVRRKCK